jgi:uncharacterized protein Yka (UPF0111/DUF47 family)
MARTTIFSLFGTSPIRPLQTQMAAVIACVRDLHPFMEAVLVDDWDQVRTEQQKISQLECDADKLKRELVIVFG